jgi:hypothetical protein
MYEYAAEGASNGGGSYQCFPLRHCRAAVMAFLAMLSLAGCNSLVPGDPGYKVGFARVGDNLYVFAPLCKGGRVSGVEVIDNSLSAEEPSSHPTRWKVAEPIDDDVAQGWIGLGEDKAFRVVTVPGNGGVNLSGDLGVRISIDRAGVAYRASAAFSVKDAVVYPPAADIRTLKFAYYDGGGPPALLTPDEIRKRSYCP